MNRTPTPPPQPPPPPAPAEIGALEKHACAACGAPVEWNPAKQELACPFCGTVAPAELDRETGKVREIDLVRALREMPEDRRGWGTAKQSVQCQSCKAVSVFDPGRVGQRCDFCGSPALVPYDAIKAPIRPEGLLPFRIAKSDAATRLKQWIGSRWFAPNALKRRARLEEVTGAYLPFWTFDAHADCPWQAEAGHYYYTTETVRQGGRNVTRRVRKIRWVPASGRLQHFFDDTPVPGSTGVDGDLLRELEPFPTKDAVPYDTGFLAGFVVEHYQVVLVGAARRARERMTSELRSLCGSAVPGDTYRNLQIFPTFSAETFKLVLVPVWLLGYQYDQKPFQALVNGVTGAVAGRYPKSWIKITLAILAGIAAAAVFFTLLARQ